MNGQSKATVVFKLVTLVHCIFKNKLVSLQCCDLLENIYLCGINNNRVTIINAHDDVVICLKISTFVVSTTTALGAPDFGNML